MKNLILALTLGISTFATFSALAQSNGYLGVREEMAFKRQALLELQPDEKAIAIENAAKDIKEMGHAMMCENSFSSFENFDAAVKSVIHYEEQAFGYLFAEVKSMSTSKTGGMCLLLRKSVQK